MPTISFFYLTLYLEHQSVTVNEEIPYIFYGYDSK